MRYSKLYLSLFLFSSVNVFADQHLNSDLNTINVVGLRDAASYSLSTYSIQSLQRQQIELSQPTSTADSLKTLANVDIQGGSRAINQKPLIRGLSGNRIAQVIDGVKQNFDLAHRGSYFLPMALTQEIDVIKGASSSLWGSGALGGVIAIRTPNALDLLNDRQQHGLKFSQGYQSANNLTESAISAFTVDDKVDMLFSGYHNKARDLRLANNDKLPNSAYTQQGGLIRLGWQLNPAHRLELSHRLNQVKQIAPSNNDAVNEFTEQELINEITQWHRSANHRDPNFMQNMLNFYAGISNRLGNTSYLSRQKVVDQSTILNYYFDPVDNPYLNGQITVYNNHTKEEEQRIISQLRDQTKRNTLGVNLRNNSEIANISFAYGIDFAQDRAKTLRGTNLTDGKFRANGYNAKSDDIGAYLLAHVPLWKEKVILSPNFRYDSFQTKNGEKKYSEDRWSPSVALTWYANSWLDLTARYTEAFRAPSMQERFVSGSHFGIAGGRGRPDTINTFKENPDLKAETSKNKEISAKIHFSELFSAQDKLNLNFTYFQNDVKNFINLEVFKANPNSSFELIPLVSQYQNIANARLSGIEANIIYQNAQTQLGIAYGQTRGKNKTLNQSLANISADKIVFNASYELFKNSLTAGVVVSHYLPQDRVPKNHTTHYEGYTLTDIQLSYQPMNLKNFKLNLAIDNLFDRKYQPAFSLMEGAGRNFKANLAYTF